MSSSAEASEVRAGRTAAAILGCTGTTLNDAERRFFARAQPLGFILFARNCETPQQIAALVRELRASVGRADAPVLIDQEGGRVLRLRPPVWFGAPPAARYAEALARDAKAGHEAAWLGARLIADDLHALGIDVDCAPVLDVPTPGAHDVIGDRAFGRDPATVARLGRAFAEGLLAGGVLPIVKHTPGHGRANADSHHALPVVDAPREDLEAQDFAPFRALNDLPWAMTAHVVYSALDAAPATLSPRVIGEVVRGWIGFDGLLIADDLNMEALSGSLAERAALSRKAGCDIVFHCNGRLNEMEQAVAGAGAMNEVGVARWLRAHAWKRRPEPFARAEAAARLDGLLAGTALTS